MKRSAFAAFMVLLGLSLFPVVLCAQTQADEEELVKSLLQTGKKAIIADNMGFTEDESKAFWPVYDEFQQLKQKLNERTIKIIKDYMDSYETITNEKAEALLKEYLAIEKERTDLKSSFLPKFTKVLPAKKVARYYQIENKLDAIVKYEFAKEVPLVK
ncbi:MAG TPA: hypothetical protein VEI46_01440 [Thermodesulfovibrionales bacterium]|nr:hypothetical protein [Thermodesulfovibrionales bacterium]